MYRNLQDSSKDELTPPTSSDRINDLLSELKKTRERADSYLRTGNQICY